MIDQIITKILVESGYNQTPEEPIVFTKQNASFFLYSKIEEAIFKSFRNREALEIDTPYKTVVEQFKAILTKGNNPILEKNSSLIVFVNCKDINSLISLQQQVLLLEEDENFLKKYVILYTDESLSSLTSTPLIPELRRKIKNNPVFDQFAKEGFKSELAEYLVVMQFFVKLPFLNLDNAKEGFTSLDQKIRAVLDSDLEIYASLVERATEIAQLDFSNPEDESKIDEFLNILPHD